MSLDAAKTHDDLQLILASGSSARKAMLENAGLEFSVIPANIDEGKIMREMIARNNAPEDIAQKLAEEKARSISIKQPDKWVIGSDQVAVLDGEIFSKAKDVSEAREKLKSLRGKTHRLCSGVVIIKNNQVIWKTVECAQLKMHDFDDRFLESYITRSGDVLTTCVGSYAVEGTGAWLFSEIKGDFFTIMGMPLLPLLSTLRTLGFTP